MRERCCSEHAMKHLQGNVDTGCSADAVAAEPRSNRLRAVATTVSLMDHLDEDLQRLIIDFWMGEAGLKSVLRSPAHRVKRHLKAQAFARRVQEISSASAEKPIRRVQEISSASAEKPIRRGALPDLCEDIHDHSKDFFVRISRRVKNKAGIHGVIPICEGMVPGSHQTHDTSTPRHRTTLSLQGVLETSHRKVWSSPHDYVLPIYLGNFASVTVVAIDQETVPNCHLICTSGKFVNAVKEPESLSISWLDVRTKPHTVNVNSGRRYRSLLRVGDGDVSSLELRLEVH